MRFSIKEYEKAFPRKAEPVRVKVEPEEKVDSVIEGSSEDPDTGKTSQEPDKDMKIYTGPEKVSSVEPEPIQEPAEDLKETY